MQHLFDSPTTNPIHTLHKNRAYVYTSGGSSLISQKLKRDTSADSENDIGAHVDIVESSFPNSSYSKSQGNNDIKIKPEQINTQILNKKKEYIKPQKEKGNQKPKKTKKSLYTL